MKPVSGVVAVTVRGPFSTGVDQRWDTIVGEVVRIAGTAVATAAGVACVVRRAVTAGAIAAGAEGLAAGAVGRDQAAVGVVTGRTGVMTFGSHR